VIWAADTWLHVVTTTVALDQAQNSTISSFGRRFSPACDISSASMIDSCVLNVAATNIFAVNGTEGLLLLSNQSTSNQVITSTLGDAEISLITDRSISSNNDFSTDSLAVNVDCKPITSACKTVVESGASTPFHCSDYFQGDLTNAASCGNITSDGLLGGFLVRNLYVGFTFDSQLEHPIRVLNITSNPFYFGIGATINNVLQGSIGRNLDNDPEIVTVQHGGQAVILNCAVTTYNAHYIYSNGSVVSATITPTNTTDTTTLLAPFVAVTGYLEMYVESALRVAGLSNTSQQIADKFGISFGQIMLAASSGVMEPVQNQAEQTRTQILVTRMPKAPLFTLVVANLLYVLFGIALVCFICVGNPRESYGIKQRLTAEGLAARLFEPDNNNASAESTEEFFEESTTPGASSRIGLLFDTKAGWQYSAWDNHGEKKQK
jgi:hypothetical protein